MDGTLLDKDSRPPAGITALMDRMRAHGVAFCPASGRQLANLRAVLGPGIDDGPVIPENGLFSLVGGVELHSDLLSREQVLRVIAAVRDLLARGGDVGAVVATRHMAYIERGDERFAAQVANYYEQRALVPDLTALDLDDVLKVAVYDFGVAEQESGPRLRAAVPDVRTVASGLQWTDVMNPAGSKGRALSIIQKHLGVGPEQTAVFGDYLNDLELYAHSTLGFAMANAHPGILQAAQYVAPANTEDGVVRTVNLLLNRLPAGR
ncbi:HAD hydrolase family protein [Actinomyces respiraculi]|uniref:HAD hydrolase family protein n=2 Tax=Actinomycetaceae TaxID=2049 RepID=A0A7T0PYF2_9ACTO|nr:HAD hydrolase family protein [Actinomyces respiraculi]